MRSNLTSMRNESLADIARSLTGKRAPKKHGAEVARGLVAIEYALRASGLLVTEFGRRYADRTGSGKSGLVFKWLSGEVVPSRSKMERIDTDYPGTLELYESAFFDLLADLPISVGQIGARLARYRWENPLGPGWKFDDGRDPQRPYLVPFRDDTATLRVSNHMHGVTIILGLVREAEALGRTLDHMHAIADLYRSLPALAALPWFRPHRRLICWCVQQIHERDFLSYCLTHVDWLALRRLSRRDVQSRMADNRFRQLFWRELEREGIDVVEHIHLPFPDSLRNPLRNAADDYRRRRPRKKRKGPSPRKRFEEILRVVLERYRDKWPAISTRDC